MVCGCTRLIQFQQRGSGAWARDTTAHLPAFLHLRTTNFPALTVSRAAIKLGRNAWNVKQPRMNVDKAAEDSPSLQLPDVPVPFLRENIVGADFVL